MTISLGRDDRRLFPPQQVVAVKAIACELPAQKDLPLSRFSISEIVRQAIAETIVETLSVSTVWRWLEADALRPWRHHPWIFPRDPDFAPKAERVVELYQRHWKGRALPSDCYVISADEKTSLQALRRCHESTPPGPGQPQRVEHEYERQGVLAYLAGLDVFSGQVFTLTSPATGIEPFGRLVETVMGQEPYQSARRVFWIVDNGSSHHPSTFPARLKAQYPRATAVHLPTHASWLNQVELFFSIVQRKVLTPNHHDSLAALAERLHAFESHYNAQAHPFDWRFNRHDLQALVKRLSVPP